MFPLFVVVLVIKVINKLQMSANGFEPITFRMLTAVMPIKTRVPMKNKSS